MEFVSKRVFPSDFGGFGKVAGLQKEEKGGLKGISFISRCPPDLNPLTRIVAVCGITDYREDAAPDADGWFLSDFYLFHRLLKGVGANQIWFTSENPKDLIEKYGPYAHGNPFEGRREVLNKSFLPDITKVNNIRVVQREDLCERFVSTVRSEIALCLEKEQPLLLLVFGHGENNTHSVYIGLKSGKPEKFRISEMAKMADVRSNGRVPQISLLITSCFSGGWAMVPSLNISAMTAAGPKVESTSWRESKSLGRHCGSIYATAVLQALLKMESGPPNEFDFNSPTYAELCQVIHSTLCNDVDRLGEQHQIMFAAQDDEWEMEWKARSGIPLQYFKERWEELAQIPPQENDLTNRDPAGYERMDEPKLRLRGGISTSNALVDLEAVVRCLACEYFSSNPGEASTSGNHSLHTNLRKILNHQSFDFDKLNFLKSQVEYRLSAIRLATSCKNILDLPFPDCADFSIDHWHHKVTLEMVDRNNEVNAKAKERFRKWEEIFDLINATDIFPSADYETQGWDYIKPIKYLSVAISECLAPASFGTQVFNLEQGKPLFHLQLLQGGSTY